MSVLPLMSFLLAYIIILLYKMVKPLLHFLKFFGKYLQNEEQPGRT